VGVFAAVIPAHEHARLDDAAHEGDGFRHDIQVLVIVARYANLRLDPKLDEWRRSHGFRPLRQKARCVQNNILMESASAFSATQRGRVRMETKEEMW
jgi:hypothetical protein